MIFYTGLSGASAHLGWFLHRFQEDGSLLLHPITTRTVCNSNHNKDNRNSSRVKNLITVQVFSLPSSGGAGLLVDCDVSLLVL